MFDVDFDVDASELEGWELFTEDEKKEALLAAAAEAMDLMRQRVAKGESLKGGSFQAYSEDYQDRKSRAGRMGENYWLRLSGWMWKTQTVTVRRVGDTLRATIYFEGMRPRVKFTDPRKGSAYRRAARSQRGGFEGTWRKKEAARRARERRKWENAPRSQRGAMKEPAGSRLTVNIDKGDMVSSATIAEANDKLRPFIGLTEAEQERVVEVIREALSREKKG